MIIAFVDVGCMASWASKKKMRDHEEDISWRQKKVEQDVCQNYDYDEETPIYFMRRSVFKEMKSYEKYAWGLVF